MCPFNAGATSLGSIAHKLQYIPTHCLESTTDVMPNTNFLAQYQQDEHLTKTDSHHTWLTYTNSLTLCHQHQHHLPNNLPCNDISALPTNPSLCQYHHCTPPMVHHVLSTATSHCKLCQTPCHTLNHAVHATFSVASTQFGPFLEFHNIWLITCEIKIWLLRIGRGPLSF